MRILLGSALVLLLAAVPGSPAASPGQEPTGAAPTAQEPAPGKADAAPPDAAKPVGGSGRLLVRGGRIRVGDGKGTVVEALLAEDGRVVAFGTEAELRARLGAGSVRELDLAGAVAVPGLQDAHVRLEELGASLAGLDLAACSSLAALAERVQAQARARAPDAWIVGRGWDPGRLGLAGWPEGRTLDASAPENPVLLWSVDRRAAWVNRRALELAQIPLQVELPRGRPPAADGVLRDGKGAATGVLLGEAARRVAALAPAATREERLARILLAQEHLFAHGVTGVHDMGTLPEALELYRELASAGSLRLRIVCYLDALGGIESARRAAEALGVDPQERLRVAGVALDLDGALGTRGAALLEPYADLPGDSGRPILEAGGLLELVAAAARAGLQPALRATGDRAARLALDTYRHVGLLEPGFARLRPRVEDGLLVSTRDWPRFPELGTALVASPRAGRAASEALLRVGPERWRRALGWLRLAPHVGPMALGSRAPEGSVGPLAALAALRFGPGVGVDSAAEEGGDELPDGRLALAGATSAVAWAARQEDSLGRLLPGHLADLTVLSVDPVEATAQELAGARVLALVIHGEVLGLAAGAPRPGNE